jgi:transcription-repair coupling factor (superfamily II helicase)
LYERAERVQALVPEARVVVAHGQLREATLEKTMLGFVQGEAQILVTTAIIESGLDIPRANTMIVDRADMFGLSQLYQLRGRVGRSSERAYCYLIVPDPATLTDEARYRIEALERYADLGSGLQVATLDMELRGAGDLLGAEQSGFVASVGLELFSKMLEEVTHELRGEVAVEGVDPELSFDVEALLPEDYIDDVGVRLSFYKRLASAESGGIVDDIAQELEDRFGALPLEARQLAELMRLKTDLRRWRALGCEANGRTVRLHLREDTPLDSVRIARWIAQQGSSYRLSPDGRVIRTARPGERFANGLAHVDKMLEELEACRREA